ncbi:MAG: hypothetical protein K2O93_09730 [Oscillospiraceae bacterium]|nr:hypothetical protein [Oscillospiraceae bacterium]
MEQIRAAYQQEVRQDPGIPDSEAAAACRRALEAAPGDPKCLRELAFALKAQLRYREASEVFSALLAQTPFSGEVLCQRGHVYLGLRAYWQAIADFELGLRVQPEDWDCLYHTALCYYLLGDYSTAERYYARCYAASGTEEELTAVSDWYWLTLMRLGKKERADELLRAVEPGWSFGENEAYFARLMVYKGLRRAEDVLAYAEQLEDQAFCTYAYGIAYYLWAVRGEKERAQALMADIASRTQSQWGGFALQAAQAELKRGLLHG